MDRIKAKDVECEVAATNGTSTAEQDEWRMNHDRKESNSLLRERKLLHPIKKIDLYSKIHNSLN